MEALSDILSKGDLNFLSHSHFLKTLVYTVSIIVTFLLEYTFLWINVNKSCMLIEQKKISYWYSQSFRWPIWFFLITCSTWGFIICANFICNSCVFFTLMSVRISSKTLSTSSFWLYTDERTGNLAIICANKDAKLRVKSQMEMVVRTTWSNSPNHGARIVASVLNNPAYYAEW